MEVSSLFTPSNGAESILSTLARGVIGSEILKIASDIRTMKAQGATICNLTVGDFDPAYFPVPAGLLAGTKRALDEGHTNYPPSDGVLQLREAIVRYYSKHLNLTYPVQSVMVTGGARALIYGAFQALVDPGDAVVYPVPSWNNHNYCQLVGARRIEVATTRETGFFPTSESLRPHLAEARMLVLNSPLNPTGTVISPEELRSIATMIVEENQKRASDGRRPLFLLYDQVYWTLTFGGLRHYTPVELVPECAPYTIMLDAVSKSFCGTGLRVGWGVMPPVIRNRIVDIMGHVGAWAPKPEQVATARLLDNTEEVLAFHKEVRHKLQERLDALYEGFSKMQASGLPVEAIPPQGAIYLSVRFNLFGSSWNGEKVVSNQQIRQLLLKDAGIAVVPFQAFGLMEENGWVRLSVGSVSMAEIESMLPRVEKLLEQVTAVSAEKS